MTRTLTSVFCRKPGVRFVAATLCVAATVVTSVCSGTAHVPPSDTFVLERLPKALLAARQVRQHALPADAPRGLDAALAAARRYVEIGQLWSDPRAYGYAQAALGPWWTADPAPSPLLMMRARILQFRHEFPAALAQLEAALRNDQFDPDAWLLFASIAQVQDNVPAARRACLKLLPISDPLVGATCVAATAALDGRSDRAEILLASALQQASAAAPPERAWAWTTLAEIRVQRGDSTGAERAFDEALRILPDHVYTRAAYADLLLDYDRVREARAILGDVSQADALLLRAAIAARRNNDADAAALRDNLAQRFAEARARGDQAHLREQARFALEIEHDNARALDLARRNFATQRETADARVLLEAARADGDAGAAAPALQWLRRTGNQAPRLLQLAQALGQDRAR